MSIENFEMIAQHEITARWHGRLHALTLIAAIGVVLAAVVNAL